MREILEIAVSNVLVAGLLAACALIVTRTRRAPVLAHCLWLLVMVKLVTPPLFRVALPLPAFLDAAGEGVTAVPALGTRVTGDLAEAGTISFWAMLRGELAAIDWTLCAGLVWAVGCAFVLILAGCRVRRFRESLRHARPAPGSLTRTTTALARKFGIRRAPTVLLLPGRVSPMLWAFGQRPVLLLPDRLVAELGRDQRAALIAHELAHLRRRDHVVRYLELAVRAVYWWNPLVWWACHRLHAAEEECCDAWVVWAVPGGTRAYADALLETVEFLSGARCALPVTASGAGRAENLRWRLTMIMQGRRRRTLSPSGRAAVVAAAALTLPLLPAFAQDHARSKEERGTEYVKKEHAAKVHEAVGDYLRARSKAADVHEHQKLLHDHLMKALGGADHQHADAKTGEKWVHDVLLRVLHGDGGVHSDAAHAKKLHDTLLGHLGIDDDRAKTAKDGPGDDVQHHVHHHTHVHKLDDSPAGQGGVRQLFDRLHNAPKAGKSDQDTFFQRMTNESKKAAKNKVKSGQSNAPPIEQFYRALKQDPVRKDKKKPRDNQLFNQLIKLRDQQKKKKAKGNNPFLSQESREAAPVSAFARTIAENKRLSTVSEESSAKTDTRVVELEKRVAELTQIVEELRRAKAKNHKRLN